MSRVSFLCPLLAGGYLFDEDQGTPQTQLGKSRLTGLASREPTAGGDATDSQGGRKDGRKVPHVEGCEGVDVQSFCAKILSVLRRDVDMRYCMMRF